MEKIRAILDLLILCLVYSIAILLINVVMLLLVFQELTEVISYFSLVTLAEGGLGMIAGGFVGLNSPIIRRIEEDLFHSKTRNPKDLKEHEKQAKKLIVTGIILVIAALLFSVI